MTTTAARPATTPLMQASLDPRAAGTDTDGPGPIEVALTAAGYTDLLANDDTDVVILEHVAGLGPPDIAVFARSERGTAGRVHGRFHPHGHGRRHLLVIDGVTLTRACGRDLFTRALDAPADDKIVTHDRHGPATVYAWWTGPTV